MTNPAPPLLPPIFADLPVQMPHVLQEQFLIPTNNNYNLVFTGATDRVWHRHGWLRLILTLLAKGDMIFPETGYDVPATMVISTGQDQDGRPHYDWNRTFEFKTQRRINAKLEYGS